MKCKEIQENLSAYLDKELSEIEIKLVEKHLKECLECSSLLSSLKKAVNILQAMPALNVSEKFTENLFHKINSKDTKILFFPKNINKKILSYVVIAACLLLVIKITFFQRENLQISKINKMKQKKLTLKLENNYEKKQNTLPLQEDTAKVQKQPKQLAENNLSTSLAKSSNPKKPQQKILIYTKNISKEKFKIILPAAKNENIKPKNTETEKSKTKVNQPVTNIALANTKKQNDEQEKKIDSKDLDKNTTGEKKSTDETENISDNTTEGSKAKIIPNPADKKISSKKSLLQPATYEQEEIIKVNFYVPNIKAAKQLLKKLNFKKTNKNIYKKEIASDSLNNDLENLKKYGEVEIVSNINKDKETGEYETKQAKEMPSAPATDNVYKKNKGEENLKGISGGFGNTTTSSSSPSEAGETNTKNQKNKKKVIKIYLFKGAKK